MPRLTLSLPEEFGTGHDGAGEESRALGAGIEGTDELTRQIDRWLSCWATAED